MERREAKSAFGDYLRDLRQRSGLSQRDVAQLSTDSSTPLDTGTLSRYESGRQQVALRTLPVFSRLYDVDIEAVVERFELDTAADQFSQVSCDGDSRSELASKASNAFSIRNRKWDAYIYFREAVALEAEAADSWTAAHARMNLATAARSLGRNRLALHEYETLLRSGDVPDQKRPQLFERIASCHRTLGDFERARSFTETALDSSRETGNVVAAAYSHMAHALVYMDIHDHASAIESLRSATEAYRSVAPDRTSGPPKFEASILTDLAEAYLILGQPERSMRAALLARDLAVQHRMPMIAGYSEVFLGDLEERAGNDDNAIVRWVRAADRGEELSNHRLQFLAHLRRYSNARRRGQSSLTRALFTKLNRLKPWLAPNATPVRIFRELAG